VLLAAVLVVALAAAVSLPAAYLRGQDSMLAAGAKRIAELQGALDTERTLLPGSAPAVAAAQLQGDLAGLAAAMGGEITTVQILEPEAAPPFARIGLRLSLNGDTATVRDFLYAIETREPMLIVRRMDLAVGGAGDADSVENPPLVATFEIYGYAPGAILP
jgi:hypothetical protein